MIEDEFGNYDYLMGMILNSADENPAADAPYAQQR